MEKMTDSRAVEVIRQGLAPYASHTETARAVEHIAARLREPAEAQAVAVCGERPSENFGPKFTPEEWDRLGRLPPGTKLYAAPPSAPVGWKLVPVEPTPEMRQAYHDVMEAHESATFTTSPDDQWNAMLAAAPALAQQPASDGGFTAADMMDARQEGRKEAQQPAACPKCDGTGEADSGGIMPWGAPATIPCDCQQPAAVDGAMVERACRAHDRMYDHVGSDTRADMRERMYAALTAALEAAREYAAEADRRVGEQFNKAQRSEAYALEKAAETLTLTKELEAAREDACVALVADIRFACGDNGKRMQPELVEFIRELAADAAKWRESGAGK